LFEIGSITKVFTSLLLADLVERGELTLDTPVAKLLPDSVKVPSRNGKQITLLDISMQVSGLPRMPSNFHPADPDNPFADYDAAKLYEFLRLPSPATSARVRILQPRRGLLATPARKGRWTYEQLLRAILIRSAERYHHHPHGRSKRLATGHDQSAR
jgi:CubicO group peptidase (beta-lactamase class C family)